MVCIDVYVPETRKHYSVNVSEEIRMRELIIRLQMLVNSEYEIFDCEGMRPISKEGTLGGSGIVNGSRLIMLRFGGGEEE